MPPKLKRSRSAVSPDQPEQTHPFADLFTADFTYADFTNAAAQVADFTKNTSKPLVQSLATGRTSSCALTAVLSELSAVPQNPIDAPSTARETQIKHLLFMDMLFEAARSAREKARAAWERTPWELERGSNINALDKVDDENGVLVPDGCSICGVPKTECVNQGEHFGVRGESPPDVKCPHCTENFYNKYDSGRALQLHIAAIHAAKTK